MNTSSDDKLNASQINTLHLYDLVHSIAPSPLTKLYTELFTNNIDAKSMNLPVTVDYKICLQCGTLLIPGFSMRLRIKYPKKRRPRQNMDSVQEISPENMVSIILQDLKKHSSGIDSTILAELQEITVEKLTYKQVINKFKRKIYDMNLPQDAKHALTTTLSKLAGDYKVKKGNKDEMLPPRSPTVFTALPLPMLIPPTSSSTVEPAKPRYLQIKCLQCNYNFEINTLIQKNDKVKPDESAKFEAKWTGDNTNKVSKTSKAKNRAKSRKQNNLSAMLNNKKKEKEKGGIGSLQLMDFLGNT